MELEGLHVEGERGWYIIQICFVVTIKNVKNNNLDYITNINTTTTDCHSTSIFGFILDSSRIDDITYIDFPGEG